MDRTLCCFDIPNQCYEKFCNSCQALHFSEKLSLVLHGHGSELSLNKSNFLEGKRDPTISDVPRTTLSKIAAKAALSVNASLVL